MLSLHKKQAGMRPLVRTGDRQCVLTGDVMAMLWYGVPVSEGYRG